MPRYPEWFKKVGDTAAHPKALDVGKKLLGYLAIRRETPGVQTLVQRVTLDDGTTVEASFAGDQPQVIVYSPDGKDACELYVESGLLDLGPNIAGDADKRFNRGPPQFDDKPATLYFGDGVDCKQGEAGLNGKVRVNPRTKTLASECLPNQGKSVQSRLRDPKKKQAQAMLPASCWSGLMQRYVQAVYGGDALTYHAAGGVLFIEGIPVGGIGYNVGLVIISGELFFVFASSTSISVAPPRFKSDCDEAVYRAWMSSKEGPARDKLLTVALSVAVPDVGIAKQVETFDPMTFLSPYGWQFKRNAAEAYSVVERIDAADDVAVTIVKRMRLGRGVAGVTVEITDIEQADIPPYHFGCNVSSPGNGVHVVGNADTFLTYGMKFDAPVGCYLDADDALVTVRYVLESPIAAPAIQDGCECIGCGFDHHTWPTPNNPNPITCTTGQWFPQSDYIFPVGYMLSTDHRDHVFVMTNAGIYAKSEREGVLWSTIKQASVAGITVMKTDSHENAILFRKDFAWLVKTVAFADGSPYVKTTHTEVSTEDGATSPYFPWIASLAGHNGAPWAYPPLDGKPECIGLSGGEFLMCSATDEGLGRCTGHSYWDMSWGANHCEDGGNLVMDCSVKCAVGVEYGFSGKLVLGHEHYMAIPLGDSSAVVAISIQHRGAMPSNNAYTEGFTRTTSAELCPGVLEGNCTGSSHINCTGCLHLPEGDPIRHAPHVFEAAFTGPTYDGFMVQWDFGNRWYAGLEDELHEVELKSRCFSDLVSVIAGWHGVIQESKLGEYENHESGEHITWVPPVGDRPPCPAVFDIVAGDILKGKSIVVDGKDGDTCVEQMLLDGPNFVIQNGFNYVFRRSLLNAATAWQDALTFGASINMDRETITGGYPKVSTPSFVGWA